MYIYIYMYLYAYIYSLYDVIYIYGINGINTRARHTMCTYPGLFFCTHQLLGLVHYQSTLAAVALSFTGMFL